MIKPAAARVDLGLILPEGTACTDRLESAATFNALSPTGFGWQPPLKSTTSCAPGCAPPTTPPD